MTTITTTDGSHDNSKDGGRRRSRGPRNAPAVARGVGLAVASFTLLTALSVGAEVHYPASGSVVNGRGSGLYMRGLTPQSDWRDILKTPGVKVELPTVSLGSMFVPASALCIERDMMRVADPRMDRGLRVAVPGPRRADSAPSAGSGYATQREDPFAIGPAAVVAPHGAGEHEADQTRSMTYMASVYYVIQTGNTPWMSFLFNKPWEVPSCATQ